MPTTQGDQPRRPRTREGETRAISICAELADTNLIESLIAKLHLRNPATMSLSSAQIVLLALEQYAAAVDDHRNERRNFESKNLEPAPRPTDRPTPKLQEIDARLKARRRRRAQIMGAHTIRGASHDHRGGDRREAHRQGGLDQE